MIAFVALASVSALAQDNDPMPDDVAPPPLKMLSKEETSQIASESGVKDRAYLYIDLMELRLKKAEELTGKDSFSDALNEFGVYNGLLENVMRFLGGENKSNKALGCFRKLEMTLRGHNLRIETVKRTMPFKYAFHVTKLQKYVRKSRAEAAESLFSDSVVPQLSGKN
jgi:hypothetical protein